MIPRPFLVLLAIAGCLSLSLLLVPNPTTLTLLEKQRIAERLKLDMLHGQILYNLNTDAPPPYVLFDLTDPTMIAGAGCKFGQLDKWVLRVNERKAAMNVRRFLRESVPHEAGHLLLCQMGDLQWDLHTNRWRAMVRDLGSEPNETIKWEE